MNPLTLIQTRRLLAAATIEISESAPLVAQALLNGGLDVMEVTFRNTHAAESIRRIRSEVPDMCVGAGTLLTAKQVEEAKIAGAHFGVSPGFNPTVVRACAAQGLPFITGVQTSGEIERALELGCSVVKLFPAAAIGGTAYIEAIAGPYAHTLLRLIPFGGIHEQNLSTYLALPLVAAVGGSWLTDTKLVRACDWTGITDRARRARAIAS